MNLTVLRAADPAAGLEPDPSASGPQLMLREILAAPVTRPRRAAVRHRSGRRIAIAVALTGAAAVAAGVVLSHDDAPRVGPAGYTVTTGRDGTVRAVIRWSVLSDPAELQAALDRAGARVKIFVETESPSLRLCPPSDTNGYRRDAVDWDAPGTDTSSGLVVHPDKFPAHGTFVVVVTMAPAGSSGGTLGPGYPPIMSTSTYMQLGSVSDPVC